MVGDPYIYYLLLAQDDDFSMIFKIKSDFDPVMEKNDEHLTGYASFVRRITNEEKLPPFANTAVASLVEYGVRESRNQKKISSRLSDVADLIREAAYWAKTGVPRRRRGCRRRAGDHRKAAAPDHGLRQGQGTDEGRGHHDRHRRGAVRPGQRPGGLQPRQYLVRRPQPDYRRHVPGSGGDHQYRARGEAFRQHPRQGGPDPHRLPEGPLRPGCADDPFGVHLF